jgi:hypothetical protein
MHVVVVPAPSDLAGQRQSFRTHGDQVPKHFGTEHRNALWGTHIRVAQIAILAV